MRSDCVAKKRRNEYVMNEEMSELDRRQMGSGLEGVRYEDEMKRWKQKMKKYNRK